MKKYFLIATVLISPALKAQMTARTLSEKLAATIMHEWKDSFSLDGKPAKWTYDMGVILKGMEGKWLNSGDASYYNYIQQQMDVFVKNDGTIRNYRQDEYTLDNINSGKLLLLLYRSSLKDKYLKAATLLRDQLKQQPRNSEGGFWHKKVYPDQMWLDGLYMAEPFYAEYAMLMHEDSAFNDIASQFVLAEKNTRDPNTGLLYHAWDASKKMKWADPNSGHSSFFWSRAMGWYACALVDVLDYFPKNHPQRKVLIDILNRLVNALEKEQDKTTGLWKDILHYSGPGKEKNYFEASASSQFVYTIAKGVMKGYLPESKFDIAQKGYNGIVKEFVKEENGQTNLHGTVKVSGLGGNPYRDGSFDYYMSEPVIVNDPKGLGAALLAADEMEIASTFDIGKGHSVMLDNYFNHEFRKDPTGADEVYHYVWNELDNNGYSILGHVFNKFGVQINTLKDAPTLQNLKDADFYIIVDPDTDKETKTPNYIEPKDITAIQAWVKAGGILLLMANDSGNVEFEHLNHLSETFGIHFNGDSKNRVQGSNFEQGAIMVPSHHPILTLTSRIYIKELSTITVKAPATIVLKNGDDNIIAVAKYGKGQVFAVGDPWLYNEYTDGKKLPVTFENYRAANDLVQWLIRQSPKK